MKSLKCMTWLQWLGIAATALVIIWWAVVFHFLSKQTGDALSGYIPCMYAPTTDCNMLRGMAWLRGINPYEPLAFWWAASITALAWGAKQALRRQLGI
jgi:hypothetical protein